MSDDLAGAEIGVSVAAEGNPGNRPKDQPGDKTRPDVSVSILLKVDDAHAFVEGASELVKKRCDAYAQPKNGPAELT